MNSIKEEDIRHISVKGKDAKKHLKVEFSTLAPKLEILRAVRTVKPDGLFVNDYLTAKRAKTSYELRQLKKNCEKIMSVFPWHGTLKCKLVGGKYMVINSEKDLTNLKEKIRSEETATLVSTEA